MAWMDPLTANLLDLLFELRNHRVPLTIGGGFGSSPQARAARSDARTDALLATAHAAGHQRPRSFCLRGCALRSRKHESGRGTLDRLGYAVVPDAQYMQWKKHFDLHGQDREIKVDLLVGPLGQFRERLHVKGVRARPMGPIKLHAHTLEEAVHIDESPVTLTVSGQPLQWTADRVQVHLPQPFTYLMMKLFAFRDRKDDADKGLGRHHALDLYAIVAMHSESEYQESLRLGNLYGKDGHVVTACGIVRSDFAEPTSIGVIRLREHPLFRPDFPVPDFLAVLTEIFTRVESTRPLPHTTEGPTGRDPNPAFVAYATGE